VTLGLSPLEAYKFERRQPQAARFPYVLSHQPALGSGVYLRQSFPMTASPAINHSIARRDKARAALHVLESAPTLASAEGAWSDLLLAGNAIFTKLEQGSKANGKASAWFGGIKKIRKDDPLLSYMHHARNSEEHGLEDVTKRMKAGQATITFREPYDPKKLEGLQLRIDATSKPGHVLVSSSNEDVISTKVYDKPALALVQVKDRGVYYDPPYEHQGKALADQSPVTIAGLFVDYLSGLIDDAKSYGI
jgi:hypothetical protein